MHPSQKVPIALREGGEAGRGVGKWRMQLTADHPRRPFSSSTAPSPALPPLTCLNCRLQEWESGAWWVGGGRGAADTLAVALLPFSSYLQCPG